MTYHLGYEAPLKYSHSGILVFPGIMYYQIVCHVICPND